VTPEPRLEPTPSQTVGPFFHFALTEEDWLRLVALDLPQAIRIEGTVRDGAGEPATDAMVEIWQANSDGRYAHPEDHRDELPLEEGFTGFGR
jgi:protocatechuate 3,4-dioxygenase alpha subunit